MLMKMNNRASAADGTSGLFHYVSHGGGWGGVTDHGLTQLTQLLILIGFQYQCEFEESLIPFIVELCWEILRKILLSYYYLTDLLITNYHMRVIPSLPCLIENIIKSD